MQQEIIIIFYYHWKLELTDLCIFTYKQYLPLVQRQSYCCSFVYCDGTNFCYITQASLTHNNTPDIVITKNTRFIKKTFHPLYILTPPFSIMESRSFTSCIISFLGFLKICLLIFVKVFSWKLDELFLPLLGLSWALVLHITSYLPLTYLICLG